MSKKKRWSPHTTWWLNRANTKLDYTIWNEDVDDLISFIEYLGWKRFFDDKKDFDDLKSLKNKDFGKETYAEYKIRFRSFEILRLKYLKPLVQYEYVKIIRLKRLGLDGIYRNHVGYQIIPVYRLVNVTFN